MQETSPARAREAKFAALVESTHSALLAYATRRVVVPADAADVVAETYLVAWRRVDSAPPTEESRPWLFGIARGVLHNHQRGERRRLSLASKLRDQLATSQPSTPSRGLSDVERAMDQLSHEDREILRLLAWEALTREEIAIALGLTQGAVRVRLHRARRRLATHLSHVADEDTVSRARRVGPREFERRPPRALGTRSNWEENRAGLEERR